MLVQLQHTGQQLAKYGIPPFDKSINYGIKNRFIKTDWLGRKRKGKFVADELFSNMINTYT